MVEALAKLDLFMVSIDVLSERLRCTEIEWRTFNLQDLTCRNGRSIGRQVEVGIDLADLILDGWGRIGCACQ